MNKMNVVIDLAIDRRIFDKVNEFFEVNKRQPTKLKLGFEQYRDLWLLTYYTYTRDVNKPHKLTKFAGCDIEITNVEEIICE
jgi:hypothetical protein